MVPDVVMLFAAGFGTRMGELTQTRPKPMIPVQGKPLIDHAIALIHEAKISNIVVNTHYLPDTLESHLSTISNLTIIREMPDILETGGGLKNALPVLGKDPIFTLNSDMIWTGNNPLNALKNAWNPTTMDALLMLIPRANAQENRGAGDFFADDMGRLTRRASASTAPFVYSGTQIIKTDLLASISQNSFSLNLIWDQMIAQGRLFGIPHSGGWVDVGRPEGIAVAEAELKRHLHV